MLSITPKTLFKSGFVLAIVAIIINLTGYIILTGLDGDTYRSYRSWLRPDELISLPDLTEDHHHPIIHLLHKAEDEFNQLVAKKTIDLNSAAMAYRENEAVIPLPASTSGSN